MHLHLQRSKLLTFPELCALICDKYYTGKNVQTPPGTLLCWRNKTLRDFHFFSFVSNLRFLLEWTHLKEKAASKCRMICRPSISSARMINTWSRWVLFILPPKCIPISPPSLHQNLLAGVHADFPASGAFSMLQSEVPCFKSLRASLDLVRNAPVVSSFLGWNPSLLTVFPKAVRIGPDSSSDRWVADPSVTVLLYSAFLTRRFRRALLFPLAWPEMTSAFSRKNCRVSRRLESSLLHLETPCLVPQCLCVSNNPTNGSDKQAFTGGIESAPGSLMTLCLIPSLHA